MADGSITFDTAIDNKGLQKDLARTRTQIEQATKKISGLEIKRGSLTAEIDSLGAKLEASGDRIVQLMSSIDAQKQLGLAADQQTVAALKEEERANKSILTALEKAEKKVSETTAQIDAETKSLEAAKGRAGQLAEQIRQTPEEVKKSTSAMDKLGKRIGSLAKSVFAFTVITKALSKLRDYIGETIAEDERFQQSLATLRYAWQAAFQPVVDFVIPVVLKVMDALAKLGYAIASIVSKITGKSIKAVKKETNEIKSETKATKQLTKARRQLAGFDEMNVLQDDSTDAGGSDFGGGSDSGGAKVPGIDTSELEASIDRIMIIASGAALALGCILVATGHLPLGIALIIAGAAGLAAEVAVNWGSLENILGGEMASVTAIVSGALLVLGAILAFSGAQLPLGIGLMVVGAAGLAGVVAVNWGSIMAAMQGPVGAVTALISGALLAIGAIFAFTGTLPLGIGLMVAGAAGLAAAIIPNWDTIVTALKGPVGKIVAIVSGAFLALGAVLCFTGAAIPIGISLLAIGAVGMAAAIIPNWSAIVRKVQMILSTLEGILILASIPIGAILLLSGNIPLGLAVLGLGIGRMFQKKDWDSNPILQKIKGVLNSIIGFVEGFVNKVIGAINWLIDQINKVSFDVPNWVPGIGGKNVGLNIRHVNEWNIPRLASGAVIPANREFLAVLGDQKSGTNIEAPLETIVQAFREALGGQGGNITIPIYLNGRKIANEVINIAEQRRFAQNNA